MARDPLSTNSDDSLALRVVEIFRRRALLAVAIFAMVLGAAISFALYLPDLYRASALVLVERSISESILKTPVSGELESRLYVIKQEILSRDKLIELIERFNLYSEMRKRTGLEEVLTQARNDILVEPAGPEQVSGRTKTVSFTLSYTGDTPQKAADVTNAVAAFYVQQNDRMRSDEAIRTSEFLRSQLADAKRQLDRHEAGLRDYTTRYTGQLPEQVGVNLATLERLNTQLRLNGEQQIRIIEQRDKLLDGLRDTGVVARTSSPDEMTPEAIERLKKIDEQKQKLSQAVTQFTDKHPDVVRLREQLAAMEREHEQGVATEKQRREDAEAAARVAVTQDPSAPAPQLRRRTMEALDGELAKLKDEETGIRQAIGGFEQRLESSPQRMQEYQAITRDWSAAKDNYDSLLKRYDEAQLTESMETGRAGERFRVLEPALPPEGPSAPNRVRLLIMGLLLALAGAAGAALAREQFDTAFHSVDELREFTSVPVLVSIPPIGKMPAGRRVRTALAAVSALVLIALVASSAAYLASGNDQLVRMIAF